MELLTIMLTDRCNSKCIYCYENVLDIKKMGAIDFETLKKSQSLLLKCKKIHFYGGEILLEENKIFYVHKLLKKLFLEKKIPNYPEYIFSTNLTILTEEFKDFLDELKRLKIKYKIVTTIDGISCIHSKYRKLRNNDLSFDIIKKNNKYFLENKHKLDIVYIIYHKKHIINNISMGDCIKNLVKNFPNIEYIVINNEKLLTDFKLTMVEYYDYKLKLIGEIFLNILEKTKDRHLYRPFLKMEIKKIIENFYSKESEKYYCLIYGKKLTIMPNRKIYMCIDEYYMGRKAIASIENIEKLKLNIDFSINLKRKTCSKCKYKKICHICPYNLEEIEEKCKFNLMYYNKFFQYLKYIFSKKEYIIDLKESFKIEVEELYKLYNILIEINNKDIKNGRR